VPVAKRNFRKRHKHGASGRDEDNDDASLEEDGGSEEGEPGAMVVTSEIVASSRSDMKDSIPSQISTCTASKGENKKGTKDGSPIGSEVTITTDCKSPQAKAASGTDANILDSNRNILDSNRAEGDERVYAVESRRKHWESLLEQRPQTKDGEAMTSWLMQVLAVSDLGKPLSETEELPAPPLDSVPEGAGADAKLSMKANSTAPAASDGDIQDDRGSPDNCQDMSDNLENQAGNDIKHLNEPGTVDECGDEKPNELSKKKSVLLKKRPVADLENGDDDIPPQKRPVADLEKGDDDIPPPPSRLIL
jgi:hypothetical protein